MKPKTTSERASSKKTRCRGIVNVGLIVVFSVQAGAARVWAGTPVLVGKQVASNQRVPMQSIDHSSWEELLKRYVNDQGMVNYKAWKANPASMASLDSYLNLLSTAQNDSRVPRAAQLAFWINAYNAVTIKGILREYPTSSIRNHTARLLGYNIWKDLKLQISDQAISLDAMEHQILRKLGEPRIHFAIVCASISCPKLQAWAFQPKKIEDQLTKAAVDFFQDSSKCQFDPSNSQVRLSQIMNWFGSDFGKDRKLQMAFIARYAPANAKRLLADDRAKISYLKYDWGLNSQN